ncbi:unnamed protein product [Staurois parvus]|uniref:Uncharacterized protein n=1 Tax=Staurois parvus TaxID=386267 RepID=A0ABN9HX13_9NEOB|nr:unnamed protein product [Staurois parvus]
MGGRTGTHDTLWTWQQHEEAAVQGPMTDYGPGSSNGRPKGRHMGQSVALDADSRREAVQGTHDTLWTWQQQEEAVQGPMAEWRSVSSLN